MASLKIRLLPDPCLRAKSKPVKDVGARERILINSLFMAMKEHKGIGLAAPQVGINEQIFVVDTGKETFAVVNPKILQASGSDMMEEGCLSIPGILVNVKRPKIVLVEFTDEYNRTVSAQLSGLAAKVFQHENDHLQGKLIIDYLSSADRQKVLSHIKNGTLPLKENKEDARI
jgi:peptide deformylase